MNDSLKQLLLAIGLLVLLVLLINPADFLMPSRAEMLLIAGLVVIFSLFAAFVWKERSLDEREQAHRHAAGHTAFLVGAAVLVLGIVVQTLSHTLSIWLPLSLGAMLIAKIAVRARIDEAR